METAFVSSTSSLEVWACDWRLLLSRDNLQNQAIFSFMGDFVYFGIPSVFHGIDRVFATTMTLYTVVTALIWFPSDIKIVVPALTYVSTIFICKSKAATKTGEESNFYKYHATWHFIAGPSAAFAMHVIQKQQALAAFHENQ